MEDAYSVKGDYFYLKKGEVINVRYAIGNYVEIKFEQKVGYFPACLIRIFEGERWKQVKKNWLNSILPKNDPFDYFMILNNKLNYYWIKYDMFNLN